MFSISSDFPLFMISGACDSCAVLLRTYKGIIPAEISRCSCVPVFKLLCPHGKDDMPGAPLIGPIPAEDSIGQPPSECG